jgi:hypothetical protein
VAEDHASKVRALLLEDVEDAWLLAQVHGDMDADRRAGETAGARRGAQHLDLVRGQRIPDRADLADDARAHAGRAHPDRHVADDLVGEALNGSGVHVRRMKGFLVPAAAHDDVQPGGVGNALQGKRIASQPDVRDVYHRAASAAPELPQFLDRRGLVEQDVRVAVRHARPHLLRELDRERLHVQVEGVRAHLRRRRAPPPALRIVGGGIQVDEHVLVHDRHAERRRVDGTADGEDLAGQVRDRSTGLARGAAEGEYREKADGDRCASNVHGSSRAGARCDFGGSVYHAAVDRGRRVPR